MPTRTGCGKSWSSWLRWPPNVRAERERQKRPLWKSAGCAKPPPTAVYPPCEDEDACDCPAHRVLGVRPGASQAEVSAAFKALWHPDKSDRPTSSWLRLDGNLAWSR